jgi:hypothetical protein
MKTVLTVVGITLAVVIVAVAGVYGWVMYSAPLPTDKLPTPPTNASRNTPTAVAQSWIDPGSVPTPSSGDRTSQTPNASAPPSSRNLVRPAPPPPTQVAGAQPGMAVPVTSPEPVTAEYPGSPAIGGASLDSMEDKLYALTLGVSDAEVSAIMGGEGSPAEDAGEYLPQGWYTLRWRESDGASIVATFDEFNTLVHVSPFKVPGAFEWMNDNIPYSLVTWLNDNLENNNIPVRVPAVQVAAVTETQYQFQAGLVTRDGQVSGSIGGNYYIGDGATTYVPGDNRAYVRAMEGSYQFYAPNGAQVADTFALAEY